MAAREAAVEQTSAAIVAMGRYIDRLREGGHIGPGAHMSLTDRLDDITDAIQEERA